MNANVDGFDQWRCRWFKSPRCAQQRWIRIRCVCERERRCSHQVHCVSCKIVARMHISQKEMKSGWCYSSNQLILLEVRTESHALTHTCTPVRTHTYMIGLYFKLSLVQLMVDFHIIVAYYSVCFMPCFTTFLKKKIHSNLFCCPLLVTIIWNLCYSIWTYDLCSWISGGIFLHRVGVCVAAGAARTIENKKLNCKVRTPTQ